MRELILAFGLGVSEGLSWAGGSQGATPANFLFLDADARAVAMGGAYSSLANDANALLYNPAGLALLSSHQAVFMHAEIFQGVEQEYAAVALKSPWPGIMGTGSGVGFMLDTLGFGSIQRTTLSNRRGAGLGAFGIRDWAVAIGYGRKLGWDWIGLGAGLKYIREEIDAVSAQAGAVDLGLMADLEGFLKRPAAFGIALQNLGSEMRYRSKGEDLPLNLRIGYHQRVLKSGLLAWDLNQPGEGELTWQMGAEYRVLQAAALRLGYNGRNGADSGIAGGGGLALKNFGLDYAFMPFGDLGAAHRLSFSYRW